MLSSVPFKDITSYHSAGKLLPPSPIPPHVAPFMLYNFILHYLFLDNNILRGFPELSNTITQE